MFFKSKSVQWLYVNTPNEYSLSHFGLFTSRNVKLIVVSLVSGICMTEICRFSVRKSLFVDDIIWKQQKDWSLSIFINNPFEAGDNETMVKYLTD